MTGNVGIHGGDAAARAWESIMGGYPYRVRPMLAGVDENVNSLAQGIPSKKKVPLGYRENSIHYAKLADAILKGKAGGYPSDIKLLYIGGCNYLTQFPNINKVVRALQSLEFIAVQEQCMTPTARFADILLPVCTYMERNDIAFGVGTAFIGAVNKVIEPLGESKSPLQIAVELAARMGIENFMDKTEEEFLKDLAQRSGVPDYAEFKKEGVYKFKLPEPYVAFKEQIKDPAKVPFRTPSGKIELYSQAWAEMNAPGLAPIPKYVEYWEGRNDPLAKKYPLQLINTHFKRRALSQFDNIPWLRELMPQAIWINSRDALARGIRDGEMVRVFNDRGEMIIQAKVTERIMPGVVDVPHGAWYDPDEKGVDRGGCVNVLTSDTYSPGGSFTYNTGLVEVARA